MFLEPVGGAAEIMADIFAKHLQSMRLVGRPLAILVQYVTLAFTRTPIGKWLAAKTNRTFPLEYFMVAEKNGEAVPERTEIGSIEKS